MIILDSRIVSPINLGKPQQFIQSDAPPELSIEESVTAPDNKGWIGISPLRFWVRTSETVEQLLETLNIAFRNAGSVINYYWREIHSGDFLDYDLLIFVQIGKGKKGINELVGKSSEEPYYHKEYIDDTGVHCSESSPIANAVQAIVRVILIRTITLLLEKILIEKETGRQVDGRIQERIDKIIIRAQRRSEKLAIQLNGPIPTDIRFKVLARDNFTCQYCGRVAPSVPLHVDHIIPRSAGGVSDSSNLVTACRDCNLGKRDNLFTTKRGQVAMLQVMLRSRKNGNK